MNISCFISGAEITDLSQTIDELRSVNVKEVFVVNANNPNIPDVGWIESDSFTTTTLMKSIAEKSTSDFTLLYTKSLPIKIAQNGIERMARMARDSSAGMLYSDYYEMKSGRLQPHPVIEYQEGSLRDDFDFGSLVLYETEALKEAVSVMDNEYQFAGLYDLRLKISEIRKIVRIPEFLYTEVETDTRKTGQKMFDYVDPKNRQIQVEMEHACSAHLKELEAYLEPKFKKIAFEQTDFPVEASVIIPVLNREKTVGDAIESVLSQKTDFDFNLIIVDNFSSDGTSAIVTSFAETDSRVIHLIPDRNDLGIGGCWNAGVAHEQ